jgi:hypothetical protein
MADTATEDAVLVKGPKCTIGFERSVQVRDYESAKASVYFEVTTEPGDTVESITERLKPAFAGIKATIYNQLGLTYEVDPTDLVVKELFEKHLGAVEVTEASHVAAAKPPQQIQRGGQGTPAPTTKDGLWEELSQNPKRYFDNRADKAIGKVKPNSPDFKRKYSGEALWMDFKGTWQVPEGVVVPEPEAWAA